MTYVAVPKKGRLSRSDTSSPADAAESNADPPTQPADRLPKPGYRGLVFNAVVTVVDVGVAIAAFQIARHVGASEAAAYVIGGVGPLLGNLVVWLRSRQASGASIAILAFTMLSAAAAFAGSRNPDALLYKDAVVTGLVGLIFAASMLFPRPLAFHFGQRYGTDGTPDEMRQWASLWRYRLFRRAQYSVTTVWAVVYLLEAAGKAYLIHSVGFGSAYTWSQLLPWAATAVAAALTVGLARHYARLGREEARDASADEPPPPAGFPGS